MRFALLGFFLFLLASCGSGGGSLDDLNALDIRLPNGKLIRAEIKKTPDEMARGMMFRNSLAADRGMLFIHDRPGNYPYWMYQCLIPLDMIWLDSEHRIVEISPDTPPCKNEAGQCPNYGGHRLSRFVLELAGGNAAANGLKPGDRLDF